MLLLVMAMSCTYSDREASARAGLADPVYAEAYVTVHQYDIVLDVTVINRTGDTLQNLCLELATMGDLKLVERPQNYTLGPGATRTVRCAAPGPPRSLSVNINPYLPACLGHGWGRWSSCAWRWELVCLELGACVPGVGSSCAWSWPLAISAPTPKCMQTARCAPAPKAPSCVLLKLDYSMGWSGNGIGPPRMGVHVSLAARLCAKLPATLSFCHPPMMEMHSWGAGADNGMLCRANIKVSSTETGAIFGNVVYETTGASERSVVRPFCPAHAALAGHM